MRGTGLVAVTLALGACSSDLDPPSPTPPPSWGVPISGGNLLVTRDGARAVIADADRDRVMTVDLDRGTATELALDAGDEPGRLVEDGAGRIHIALRGAGELLTLDGQGAQVRRAACAEPRGVAWDAQADLVHVACASGDLVTLPAAGGDAVRTLHLERDLRDVIVDGSRLVVTTFRSADVLALDASGAVVSRTRPATVQRVSGEPEGGSKIIDATPAVAWRTLPLGDGRFLVVHQRKRDQVLKISVGGYSSECGQGPVETALSLVTPGGTAESIAPIVFGTLPVDAALSPDGSALAVVTAGAQNLTVVPVTQFSRHDDNECGVTPDDTSGGLAIYNDELGAPTSVAYRANGDLVVYYPELPALVVRTGQQARTLTLPGPLGYDAGRALFHRQTGAHLACASCHPEGREDGQVWQFDTLGSRRTQSLAGGILGRAPYHWAGDEADLPALMLDVFARRMAGVSVTPSEQVSLGPWLDRVSAPQPSARGDVEAIARGETLFMSSEQGCATCHAGPLYTTNALVDVGTGGTFKVPSLAGVGARAPFMHTGCAATLRDRFGACGGGELHGKTAALTPAQLDDLVAYLESL